MQVFFECVDSDFPGRRYPNCSIMGTRLCTISDTHRFLPWRVADAANDAVVFFKPGVPEGRPTTPRSSRSTARCGMNA